MPASRFLLALCICVNLTVGFVPLFITEPPPRTVDLNFLGVTFDLGLTGLIILETLFYLCFVWVVLRIFDHSKRFLQTATALVGAETFISLLGLPIIVWFDVAQSSGGDATLPTILYLGFILWSVDVAGYVISKATENAYFVGVLIMIGYIIISLTIRESFFPVVG